MIGSDSNFYISRESQPFADSSRCFKVTELLAAYKDRSFEKIHGLHRLLLQV